jgi:hypothetical protein
MGYRSDVLLVVALRTPAQYDELMAVYAMDPLVQKHNTVGEWTKHVYEDHVILAFKGTDLKWYESYEDVQAIEHLLTLANTFAEERGFDVPNDPEAPQVPEPVFPYATARIRIGEESDDSEMEYQENDSYLVEVLYSRAGIRREIIADF